MKSIGGETDIEILQQDLDSVTEWSLRNNMKLHTDKFEFLLHGVSRDPLIHILPFTADILSNRTSAGLLKPMSSVKDLGVLVHYDLTWSGHIATITENAKRKAAWVYSVFRTRDTG